MNEAQSKIDCVIIYIIIPVRRLVRATPEPSYSKPHCQNTRYGRVEVTTAPLVSTMVID